MTEKAIKGRLLCFPFSLSLSDMFVLRRRLANPTSAGAQSPSSRGLSWSTPILDFGGTITKEEAGVAPKEPWNLELHPVQSPVRHQRAAWCFERGWGEQAECVIGTLCQWLTCGVGGGAAVASAHAQPDVFISFSSQTLPAEWNQAGRSSFVFPPPVAPPSPPSEPSPSITLIHSPLCCSPVRAPLNAAIQALVSAAPFCSAVTPSLSAGRPSASLTARLPPSVKP